MAYLRQLYENGVTWDDAEIEHGADSAVYLYDDGGEVVHDVNFDSAGDAEVFAEVARFFLDIDYEHFLASWGNDPMPGEESVS